ncbi:MAG TPA: hypothetical protein VGG12_06035 [Methylovirgula sp.]
MIHLPTLIAGLRGHIVNAPWKLVYLATLLRTRLRAPSPNKTAVVSFFMENVGKQVVAAQKRAIEKFLPPGVDLVQLKTGFAHGRTVDLFLALSRYDVIVILDIDCIPIVASALPDLIAQAQAGALVGAAQRANHIGNNDHIYVGPFLMGFSRATHARLGHPSFQETKRGDVGEELTYRAEAAGVSIHFLWPTSCDEEKWHLKDDIHFGRNTIYDRAFLHAFQIRKPEQQAAFVETVARVLGGAA